MKNIKSILHLHLFDGGAAGAASAGDGDGAGTGGFANLENGSESAVVYGKQENPQVADGKESQVAADEKGQSTQVDKSKAFKDMIKGEYKEEYQKLFETQLTNRMKRFSGMEEQLNQSQEVLGMLYNVYGVPNGDMESLSRAIQNDDNLILAQAEAAGLAPEQYRYMLQLQQQADMSRQQAEAAEQQAFIQNQMADWQTQAEEFKGFFPDFDLASELQNPDFAGLLQGGISVRAAFNAVHADEIIDGAIAQTAQSVKESVTENIRARGNRPAENGTVARAGVVVKNDPSKLTRQDREEIARRVARGENIAF